MTVQIPPELQQFVDRAVANGLYGSQTEVVGEALRLLQERERRREELRAELNPALERLDRGEGIQLDEDSLDGFSEDVKSLGRKRLEAERDAG
jgi:antitoxin ParD1/3/4